MMTRPGRLIHPYLSDCDSARINWHRNQNMQSLRQIISKHGLAAELSALFASVVFLAYLLVDALQAGDDGGRAFRDIVVALIFSGIVTGAALALGDRNAQPLGAGRDD
ncbi:hypothetical protein [Sphingomonas sp. UYP23]